jgi:hypothetical protein
MFEDIHGRTFDPSVYGSDWLIIYTAASRHNFGALTKFIKKADQLIKAKHPTLKSIVVAVADLRVVPKNMQNHVLPVLKMVDKTNVNNAANAFTKQCPGSYNAQDLFFCADWSGEIVEELFSSDADSTYRLCVVGGGNVLAYLDNTSDDGAYVDAIDSAVMQHPAVVASWPSFSLPSWLDKANTSPPSYPDHKTVAMEDVKVKPGKVTDVEVQIAHPSFLGCMLQVTGAKTIEVSIIRVAADGAADEAVIVPKRKVECSTSAWRQVCHVAAGSYRIQIHNTGSVLKSKKVHIEVTTSSTLSTSELQKLESSKSLASPTSVDALDPSSIVSSSTSCIKVLETIVSDGNFKLESDLFLSNEEDADVDINSLLRSCEEAVGSGVVSAVTQGHLP